KQVNVTFFTIKTSTKHQRKRGESEMRFRMMIIILFFVAVISGCTNGGKIESKVTLENVTHEMESQGLKLLPIQHKGGNEPFGELNKAKARTYAIDNNQPVNSANVFVYVFDSEQARIDGLKDFNEKSRFAKIIIAPSVYKNKNVLVLHYKNPDEK